MASPLIPQISNGATWSSYQKLMFLLRLPWTVRVERDPVDQTLIAHVDEVPDAIADAPEERERVRELWDSLCASLIVRIDANDPLPVPSGTVLPWEVGIAPPPPFRRRSFSQDTAAFVEPTTSATSAAA